MFPTENWLVKVVTFVRYGGVLAEIHHLPGEGAALVEVLRPTGYASGDSSSDGGGHARVFFSPSINVGRAADRVS